MANDIREVDVRERKRKEEGREESYIFRSVDFALENRGKVMLWRTMEKSCFREP